MFFKMNRGSRTVNSQTAPASFNAAESTDGTDLIERLEQELARSRVRQEALKFLLKTKAEESSGKKKAKSTWHVLTQNETLIC